MKVTFMKRILLALTAFSALASTAMADTINYTTDSHWFTRYPDQMAGIVANEERALNQYTGESLECRLVQLQFNNLQTPKIFRTGPYTFQLPAQ